MKLKVSFYLKSGISTNIPVIALVSYGYSEFDVSSGKKVYKPLRYYTGFKTEFSDWDRENNKPSKKNLQTELSILEKRISEIYIFLKQSKTEQEHITPDELKNILDKKLKGKKETNILRISLVDFINDNLINSEDFKLKTRENYKTVKYRIEEFEKLISKTLYVSDVNEQMFKQFINYIRERSNKINTVWSIKKDFVSVLNKIAHKYKITVFNPSNELLSKDKVSSVFVNKVYLSFTQMKKVIDSETENEREQNIKLIFLTLLFTGCRYSDVFKVKPEFEYTNASSSFNYARFITHKGQKEVIIPILKPLQDAMDENGGTAKKVTESMFNIEIKALLRKIGLTEQRTLSYTDAKGNTQFETKDFCDFVSSHTGRRSFITNLLRYIPITCLCMITTHELKDRSIIFEYDKISLLENAIEFRTFVKQVQKLYKHHFVLSLV